MTPLHNANIELKAMLVGGSHHFKMIMTVKMFSQDVHISYRYFPSINQPINKLAGLSNAMTVKLLLKPGANVIKHFAAVIYYHSVVTPSFCVIKQFYHRNYSRMAVNCHAKMCYNFSP